MEVPDKKTDTSSWILVPANKRILCSLSIPNGSEHMFIELVKARRAADELNFIRWQYQSVLALRRDKRALKRAFDKRFAKLKSHCKEHGIKISLEK